MTEQQPYEVMAAYPTFELRRYPAHLVAEMTVASSFEWAGNQAFGPLAAYIGGRNRSGRKIPMTAPVVQEQVSERIAMTAPVVREPARASGAYVVGFVMPEGCDEATMPEPADPRVTVRRIPEQLAAAVRYSGPWTRRSFETKAARLLQDIPTHGLEVTGPLRFARYDPPWTPWFMRRNEVVAPVAETQAA